MKFRNLLTAAALTLPLVATASVPASPELRQMTNPDGSTVDLYFRGNHDFHYALSADKSTIMEKNADGYWVPAVRNGLTLQNNNENLLKLRSELPVLTRPGVEPGTRLADLDMNGRSEFPTTAEGIRGLVVLLEYSDTPFSIDNPYETLNDYCNKEGYSAYGAQGSARDYFRTVSGGKFDPHFDVYGPVKVSKPSSYYTGKGTDLPRAGSSARFGEAMREALLILDEQGVDFSIYDFDNNDVIDNIFFLYAGHGQAQSGDDSTVWPHQGDYDTFTWETTTNLPKVELDGKTFRTYACSNELNYTLTNRKKQPWLDGIGTFCHEFGHVLGLTDLYDVNYKGTVTPGDWDIMDQGAYNNNSVTPPMYSAYQQWICHWIEIPDVEAGTEYELPTLSSCLDDSKVKAVRVRARRPGSGTSYYPEYFILEARDNEGYDEYTTREQGLLVWHIDFRYQDWVDNSVNTNGYPRVEIIKNTFSNNTVFPGIASPLSYICSTGPISLKLRTDVKSFNPILSSIDYDPTARVATVAYNKVDGPIQEVPVIGDCNRAENGSRMFTVRWSPVADAQSYIVTIRYRDSFNNTYYIDNCNNKDVGNVTQYTVQNISPTMWRSKVEIVVRAFNEIPGNPSQVATFVPEDLPAAVEEITAVEAGVYGEQGRIEAPEGSRAFSINGAETGLEDLPAGVYVVRIPSGKAFKVVVK